MKRILGFFIPLSLCFSLLTGFGPALHDPADLKNDPVSTTGSLYGYQDELQEDVLSDAPFELVTGKYEVSGVQRVVTDGYAASASGKTSLALSSSYLRSETETEAAPAEGRFEKLLVSGSLNAVLGLGSSQSFYINSSLIARHGAAALLDKAAPGPQKLSLYMYGSEAIAADGGFGANTDIFNELYLYGSHIQAAEAGILAGTESKLTIGTIKDGEDNNALSGKLEDSEKDRWKDKETGSVIEGGRNALVIYSENLPEYWDNEGYSEEELIKKATSVSVKGSTLRTDEALDKGISYGETGDAYIDHTKGSVVLIKSSNATITFEDCELIAGKDGKGNLIQTVISNDTENMSAVPEDINTSGVNISMKDMDVKGNILHEDYQRNLGLTLVNTKLSGAINGYDTAHWNDAAAQEGFKDFCPDEKYDTRRIAAVAVTGGSAWTATAESHLGWLYIDDTSKVTGKILVNGVEQANYQGSTYSGDVVVIPASTSSIPAVHDHNWVIAEGGYPPDCVNNGVNHYKCSICGEDYYEAIPPTGHNWLRADGGNPPDCVNDGMKPYYCSVCGATYNEVLPALGHDWQLSYQYDPGCDYDGYADYICARCYDKTEVILPALGHDWKFVFQQPASCKSNGYEVYFCNRCHITDFFNITPPLGHPYNAYPTPEEPSNSHTCASCGEKEPHTTGTGNKCAICGYEGAYG